MSDSVLDRAALSSWLKREQRSWRWRHGGDNDPCYRGVEATRSTLVWFEWFHDFSASGQEGGYRELARQAAAEFLRSGAPEHAVLEVPTRVADELRNWLSAATG